MNYRLIKARSSSGELQIDCVKSRSGELQIIPSRSRSGELQIDSVKVNVW